MLQQDVPLRALLWSRLRAAEFPETESIDTLNRIAGLHYADPGMGNWIRHAAYRRIPLFLLKAVYEFRKWRRKANA